MNVTLPLFLEGVKMKGIKNEKGITLIEILLSIVILSITLYGLASGFINFIQQSKEADEAIVLKQEVTKQLEEQRQTFYEHFDYIEFPQSSSSKVIRTFTVDLDKEYYGEIRAHLIEEEGRYQLIKLTSSIGDLGGERPPLEVSQYVTNR